MKSAVHLIHVLIFALIIGGCSTGSGPASRVGASGSNETAPGGVMIPAVQGVPPAVGPTAMEAYQIGPGDQLQVDVFRLPDLTTKGQVNSTGSFVMPLIGPVTVGGLNPEQAGLRIAEALAKDYLQNPHVNVQVLESANMKFTVGGAVKKPGVFPMRGETTLLQAISLAEGVTDIAKPQEVVVFRNLPGASVQAYVVDLKKIQRGELMDPVLAVNDKVIVPESGVQVWARNVLTPVRGFITLNPLFY